jgi:hypothetical protein
MSITFLKKIINNSVGTRRGIHTDIGERLTDYWSSSPRSSLTDPEINGPLEGGHINTERFVINSSDDGKTVIINITNSMTGGSSYQSMGGTTGSEMVKVFGKSALPSKLGYALLGLGLLSTGIACEYLLYQDMKNHAVEMASLPGTNNKSVGNSQTVPLIGSKLPSSCLQLLRPK